MDYYCFYSRWLIAVPPHTIKQMMTIRRTMPPNPLVVFNSRSRINGFNGWTLGNFSCRSGRWPICLPISTFASRVTTVAWVPSSREGKIDSWKILLPVAPLHWLSCRWNIIYFVLLRFPPRSACRWPSRTPVRKSSCYTIFSLFISSRCGWGEERGCEMVMFRSHSYFPLISFVLLRRYLFFPSLLSLSCLCTCRCSRLPPLYLPLSLSPLLRSARRYVVMWGEKQAEIVESYGYFCLLC